MSEKTPDKKPPEPTDISAALGELMNEMMSADIVSSTKMMLEALSDENLVKYLDLNFMMTYYCGELTKLMNSVEEPVDAFMMIVAKLMVGLKIITAKRPFDRKKFLERLGNVAARILQ